MYSYFYEEAKGIGEDVDDEDLEDMEDDDDEDDNDDNDTDDDGIKDTHSSHPRLKNDSIKHH